MTSDAVRLGVIGLGRGFALSARALDVHTGIDVIAAAARSEVQRTAFESAFGGDAYSDYQQMLKDPAIEIVYVATPHELHSQHVTACLNAGKHVVVEKPLAINLDEASAMVALAKAKNLQLLVGPSHSYDDPVVHAADLIDKGTLGRPRLLHMLTATDFLYRPRRAEELDTSKGGGVVYSQAIHQIDVAMRLLGSYPVSVFARTGSWDAMRPTEVAYTAIVCFANGANATLTYSGNAHFDGDSLMDNVGELGVLKKPDNYGAARRALAAIDDETAYKKTRAFVGLDGLPEPTHHEHFGQVIVFCEHADVELKPDKVIVHGDDHIDEIDCPFSYSRATFANAIVDALRGGSPVLQTGEWGYAALATCCAILESAETGLPVNIESL